jgi:hypothetical protein
MGHSIQALVIGEAAEGAALSELFGTEPVRLGHGLSLVPITSAALDALREAHPGLTEPAESVFVRLSAPLIGVAERLSDLGPVAYIETAYVGGKGEQAAIVWQSREIRMPATQAPRGPINTALRLLGVRRTLAQDEFDVVGLGTKRRNEAWF